MSQAYDEEFLEEYLKEDVAVPTSNGSNKVTVYKVKQSGFKTEKYVRESGDWIKSDEAGKSKSRQFTTGAARGLAVGIAGAANKMLLNEGIGASAGVAVSAEKADCDVHVAKLAGVKILDAGAEAKVGNASVGASATPIQAEAFAKASGAEASAHADLVKGVFGADARAVAGEAKAKAGFGLKDLGAHAEASATVAKVQAEITNVPLAQVSATGPEAKAETGVSWKYTGGSLGAYAAEAKAGPFAARAGVKLGAGIRNGIPEADLGPVTVPCSIM